MTFARPDLIGLAAVFPLLLLAAMLLHARRRRRVAALLGEAPLLARLGGAGLAHFPPLRMLFVGGAGLALGLAAASPQWGRVPVTAETSSVNVVLALDVSKSMLASDLQPSRLERQRLLVRRLLREMPGDRFGLVIFAGRAYVLSPVTIDHGAIELYLDAIEPDIVSQGGSSLEAAVLQASDLVRGAEEVAGDRAVVLVTDGEALEDVEGIREAATRAANAGVRIYTVGLGTRAGAPVPDLDAEGEQRGFKRDERGDVVISRLGDDLLRGIAERTGAAYFDGSDPGSVERLAGELSGLERTSGASEQRSAPRDRFGSFIALALLLLALDAWLARRKAPRRLRSGPLATAALLLALLTQGFGIGDIERGNRLYRAGRYEEAAAAYREALADGERAPALRYNLGTALLQLGRHAEAEEHLRAALAAVDPELRRRTHYNLGNRFLTEARASAAGPEQLQRLDAAIEAYRQALRIAPDDADAKWNLELALRERTEQERRQPQASPDDEPQDEGQQDQDSGGGGGEENPQSGASGSESDQATDEQPLTEAQAEQILSAAEQDERELARAKLRKGQRRTPVLRDW